MAYSKKNSVNGFVFIPILAFIVYYVIVLYSGLNNYIRIHDNLDGEFLYRIMINYANDTVWYNSGLIQTVQNGLPRDVLPSNLNITSVLFGLFSPWVAYFINDAIARIVGFVGMSLLLSILMKTQSVYKRWITIITSLAFALIGSYNIHNGLTYMGVPLMMYAFYSILYHETKWHHYFIIISFAFCSQLTLIGIFILIFFGCWWMIDAILNKQVNINALIAICLLSISYIIVEYRMIELCFLSDFVHHRTEFVRDHNPLLSIGSLFKGVAFTQYHGGTLCSIPIFILCCYNYLVNKKITLGIKRLLYVLAGLILMQFCVSFAKQYIGLLQSIDLERFYFLYPTILLLIMALVCEDIIIKSKKYKIFNICLCFTLMLATMCSSIFYNYELNTNAQKIFLNKKSRTPTYKEFIDTDLFSSIDNYIGKPKESYRVVSVGIHPSISLINGFFTLDSYLVLYPLAYKHQFRDVIKDEIEKDKSMQAYYDEWGSRTYIFVQGQNLYAYSNDDDVSIPNLGINTNVLSEMGCEYIFSKYRIDNSDALNMHLLEVFDGLYWRIYLYKIGL